MKSSLILADMSWPGTIFVAIFGGLLLILTISFLFSGRRRSRRSRRNGAVGGSDDGPDFDLDFDGDSGGSDGGGGDD